MQIQELINNLSFTSVLWQIITPLIFSIADIISGFIQAVINNDVDTTKMRVGLLHKILILLIIILSFVIDFAFKLPFVANVVCIYVIIMEVTSITENITKAGIDIGNLSNILKVKREEVEKNGENEQRRINF